MEFFTESQAKEICDYAREQYGSEIEFLWEKSPENGVLRHSNNKKWYAVFMNAALEKLGFEDERRVDIIDMKCDPLIIGSIIDGKSILPGYHMNKEHWITVLLDGSVETERIIQLLDLSFEMTSARGKRK